MDLSERIHKLIEASAEGLGYDVVRVQIMGKEQIVIQIMAEPKNGQEMEVPERRIPVFRAGKGLKNALNPN